MIGVNQRPSAAGWSFEDPASAAGRSRACVFVFAFVFLAQFSSARSRRHRAPDFFSPEIYRGESS